MHRPPPPGDQGGPRSPQGHTLSVTSGVAHRSHINWLPCCRMSAHLGTSLTLEGGCPQGRLSPRDVKDHILCLLCYQPQRAWRAPPWARPGPLPWSPSPRHHTWDGSLQLKSFKPILNLLTLLCLLLPPETMRQTLANNSHPLYPLTHWSSPCGPGSRPTSLPAGCKSETTPSLAFISSVGVTAPGYNKATALGHGSHLPPNGVSSRPVFCPVHFSKDHLIRASRSGVSCASHGSWSLTHAPCAQGVSGPQPSASFPSPRVPGQSPDAAGMHTGSPTTDLPCRGYTCFLGPLLRAHPCPGSLPARHAP